MTAINPTVTSTFPVSPDDVAARLRQTAYLADEGLATAIFLALRMGKPLLLEGRPGVGKTEAAHSLATIAGRDVIRLQCYEGIDAAQALYDWNYPRQLLAIRQEGTGSVNLYERDFLIERPLLRAVNAPGRHLLLIDEIDRSDQEFEAFLLEFLADFQVTIPEIGTIRAAEPPIVVLTSNRTRELHDALRRRCVYHWIAYPDPATEAAIVLLRAPELVEATATAVAKAARELRQLPLAKPPGISETVDWARGARLLLIEERWPDALARAVGLAIKDEDDLAAVSPVLPAILAGAFR